MSDKYNQNGQGAASYMQATKSWAKKNLQDKEKDNADLAIDEKVEQVAPLKKRPEKKNVSSNRMGFATNLGHSSSTS